MHATTHVCNGAQLECTFGRTYVKGRSRLEISKAEKLVFIKGNGKGVDEVALRMETSSSAAVVADFAVGGMMIINK